jgi:predicted nucleotidyltransferase
MTYNISSDRLSNPLLKELLQALTVFFEGVGSEFYVIGATARDIILSGIHAQHSGRKTVDLDIAIAIPDWNKYQEISDRLCQEEGFTKSTEQKQRFFYKGVYMLDIVPFGDVAKEDKYIYWPPEESFAMPVHGFIEVAKDALEITVDNLLTIRVASLPGIFILKLIAWYDRHLEHDRDAEDMAFIISNYLSLNDERAARDHYDIYDRTPFSNFIAGGTLIARDIITVIKDDLSVRGRLATILREEINKTLDSPLINQMLETHQPLKYEEVYDTLLSMTNELTK